MKYARFIFLLPLLGLLACSNPPELKSQITGQAPLDSAAAERRLHWCCTKARESCTASAASEQQGPGTPAFEQCVAAQAVECMHSFSLEVVDPKNPCEGRGLKTQESILRNILKPAQR
ncbi:MAG: hypothetical protein KQJ78_12440 [Deltaproteobacteria bacterium]|nr:hypothetical protein [Deltaproteobacteria bacterium]